MNYANIVRCVPAGCLSSLWGGRATTILYSSGWSSHHPGYGWWDSGGLIGRCLQWCLCVPRWAHSLSRSSLLPSVPALQHLNNISHDRQISSIDLADVPNNCQHDSFVPKYSAHTDTLWWSTSTATIRCGPWACLLTLGMLLTMRQNDYFDLGQQEQWWLSPVVSDATIAQQDLCLLVEACLMSSSCCIWLIWFLVGLWLIT